MADQGVKFGRLDHIIQIHAVHICVRGFLIARGKANRGDASFTSPVDAIGGKIPFAGGEIGQPNFLHGFESRLHEVVIFIQYPGREVFINFEDKAGV